MRNLHSLFVKDDFRNLKKEIIQCICGNINDQDGPDSFTALTLIFHLDSTKGFAECARKFEQLYQTVGRRVITLPILQRPPYIA